MSRIRSLIEEHGGIVVLVTHPVYVGIRKRDGEVLTHWQNSILCRDGWAHALTTSEEDALRGTLPDRLRAARHLRVNEDGAVIKHWSTPMKEPKKLKPEDVMDHAAAAALFFRRLIDEGVPVHAATQMACSYVGGLLMLEMEGESPDQPWEEE